MAPAQSFSRKQIKTKLMLYKPLFIVHVRFKGLLKDKLKVVVMHRTFWSLKHNTLNLDTHNIS